MVTSSWQAKIAPSLDKCESGLLAIFFLNQNLESMNFPVSHDI